MMGCGSSSEVVESWNDDVKSVKSAVSTLSIGSKGNILMIEEDVSEKENNLEHFQLKIGICKLPSGNFEMFLNKIMQHSSVDVLGIIELLDSTSQEENDHILKDYAIFHKERVEKSKRIYGLEEENKDINLSSGHEEPAETTRSNTSNTIIDYLTTEINEVEESVSSTAEEENTEIEKTEEETTTDKIKKKDTLIENYNKSNGKQLFSDKNNLNCVQTKERLYLIIKNSLFDENSIKSMYIENFDSFDFIKTRSIANSRKCIIIFVNRIENNLRKFNFEFNIFLSNEMRDMKYDPGYFLIFGSFLRPDDNSYGFSEFNDTLDEFNLKILNDEFQSLHNGTTYVYFIGHKNDTANDIKQFSDRYEAMTGKINFRSN